jgi:hypothetical protein
VFRPDTVDLMREACRRLEGVVCRSSPSWLVPREACVPPRPAHAILCPECSVYFPRRVESSQPLLVPEPLGRAEALALLLENSFAELAHPQVWRCVWDGSRRLAEETHIQRLQVPEGLALLAEAVAAQSRTVTW